MLLSSSVSSVPESIVSISSFPLLGRLWTPVTEKVTLLMSYVLCFSLMIVFGEYLTAINGDLYGENVGALPGDCIILLCLCHGDLNRE